MADTGTSNEAAAPADERRGPIGRLIGACLNNRLVVLLAVLFAAGCALVVAPFDWDLGPIPRRPVPVDAIPDLGENQQIVFTAWPGRSPQDVDDQITYPLTSALLGTEGVKTVRSLSMFGFSSIYVIFEEGVDFDVSRVKILEKLSSLPSGTVPEGVQPALGPDATALGQIFWYTLEGRDPQGRPAGGWDLEELRTIQDWHVRSPLLSAAGVAEVASVGGFVREYQVDVDPDALRAYGVTLAEVTEAVRNCNLDVAAKTIELNRVEYFVRGVGFIRDADAIANSVVRVRDNVPIQVRHVAAVTLGPALRRGALDKGGAEAVGGVVVARYGANPLAAIKNVKARIDRLQPSLPTKVVIDFRQVTPEQVREFATSRGFGAYRAAALDHDAWVAALRKMDPAERPPWATLSQVTLVPFYDRTGLIYETLGTLHDAIGQEILVTIIVVLLMVMHLRASVLVSGMLPLAVGLCFIAMKLFGVDANIVALSGIAIAIGTIVDMGIVLCENVLSHLERAGPGADALAVVHRAASEVGGAVLTAVLTTVISFLPVFVMTGPEGKLFKPLAFTKTFALLASVLIALTVIPPAAYVLLRRRRGGSALWVRLAVRGALAAAGAVVGWLLSPWAGAVMTVLGACFVVELFLPRSLRRFVPYATSLLAAAFVAVLLSGAWEPLGPERGGLRNFLFVAGLIGGLLVLFKLFQLAYPAILRWCLDHKAAFLAVPGLLLAAGLYVFVGPGGVVRALAYVNARPWALAGYGLAAAAVVGFGLFVKFRARAGWGALAAFGVVGAAMVALLAGVRVGVLPAEPPREWARYRGLPAERLPDRSGRTYVHWALANDWNGRPKEFMPPLDEGSFLYMPTTGAHASIGEALDVLAKQDMAFAAIPEVERVVGKIGRADTPLDPAPISMIETVIRYRPEYRTDKAGRRINYRYDEAAGTFARDAAGEPIEDDRGRPFRQWRDHIRSPDDIWREIVRAGRIPGTTGAPKLQPIMARIVMLQSGMRAPMGVRIQGESLEAIERAGLAIERALKMVRGVDANAVNADRVVGKPYLEIVPDDEAIARYQVTRAAFNRVVEVAVGGKTVTTTVEGRRRFAVRVRYQRELRDTIETIGRILIPSSGGQQVPLGELAAIRYIRGPQAIKSEDTFKTGYVLFDKLDGFAEVDVVEAAERHLEQRVTAGRLVLPEGVRYEFAGTYEHQLRSQRTLAFVLPLALGAIFLLLYFQFRSVWMTALVFSGVAVAFCGGFLLIWLYGQPWFLDFAVFGVPMRRLFQVHPIHLSVAVWVGFLALFGIATDDGVVMGTYLSQSFRRRRPAQVAEIRAATVAAGQRRVRPCLMTTATTILALLPVLTSTGRGADIMVPMAIPSVGGMIIEVLTMLVVPVLFCAGRELAASRARGKR